MTDKPAPFWAGYDAAKAGHPSTACPYPQPDKAEAGDAYPGLWYTWTAGWCMFRKYTGQDCGAEQEAMHRVILRAIR